MNYRNSFDFYKEYQSAYSTVVIKLTWGTLAFGLFRAYRFGD